MAAEENWQTKLSTIVEKTAFIFNKELLSDVKFVVQMSTDESDSKKVIPAHKFVLAISSPVFFAMFYGQMAETKDSIELPDCEYESLLELFRFLYSDNVNLSGSNVMQVLYLANKYMVSLQVYTCECLDKHWRIWNYKWDDPVDLSELTKNLFRCDPQEQVREPFIWRIII